MKKLAVSSILVVLVLLVGMSVLRGFEAPHPVQPLNEPQVIPSVYAQNPIETENLLPGTRDWEISNLVTETDWTISTTSNAEIEGYASLTSVNLGEQIRLFVNTREPFYTIRIFRIGYYNGSGGREMTAPINREGTTQPACVPAPVTRLIECNWTDPYELTIPFNWVSGVYLAKLTAGVSGRESYIIFVVRDDESDSTYLFQSSVTTYQAYNQWGRYSLYRNDGIPPADKVSFNRPYYMGYHPEGAGHFFRWEIYMLRWLEREGYDVTYATNVDTHANPDLLLPHRAFLSVGHDEYWSWEMRQNVERARDRCVSLGFFSANSVFWQIRFEPSETGDPYRTIVAYKDDAFSQDPLAIDSDPTNDHLITTQWRDPRLDPTRDPLVKPPEDALIGVMTAVARVDADMVVENTWHWVFDGTGLSDGDRLPWLVGYEADRMFRNAPPGTVRLAHSPVNTTGIYEDCSPEGCFSDMTVYTAPSGAIVFATGTIQWSWGLYGYDLPVTIYGRDEFYRGLEPNDDAQQITRNVLNAFRGASCDLSPEVPLPPAITANVGVVVEGVSGSGQIFILECLRDLTCWQTSRTISERYPTILIYDRSEMEPFQLTDIDVARLYYYFTLPGSTDFKFLDPIYYTSTTAAYTGPAWVRLRYDDSGIPANREQDLELLLLVKTPQGLKWEIVTTSLDLENNLVHGRVSTLSLFAIALKY